MKEKFQIYLIKFFPVYQVYFPDMSFVIPSGDDSWNDDNQSADDNQDWESDNNDNDNQNWQTDENDDVEVNSFIECARAGYEVSSWMVPNTCTDSHWNMFMEDLRWDEEPQDRDNNDEKVDNDFWNAWEDIIDEWIQENDRPDDSAVDEDVAEELNKYLDAANNLARHWVINNHDEDPINYSFSNTILRNEAAKMAVNLDSSVSIKTRCDNEFSDVSKTTPNTWTCWYVEALRDAGKLSKNKNFNPLSQLSKAEATKMMLEAAWCKNVYTHAQFWQAEVSAYAWGNGLIPLFTDYDTKATRAFVFAIADAARVFCAK